MPFSLYRLYLPNHESGTENETWKSQKVTEQAENISLKSYCGKLLLFSDTVSFKKKKKWGEMEEYLSVFSNKTLHFIQEEKIWKLGNFCYSFSGYWVKQNSKEKLVLLWGSLTWFSSGPCSLVSWASAELIHAVSQKHL